MTSQMTRGRISKYIAGYSFARCERSIYSHMEKFAPKTDIWVEEVLKDISFEVTQQPLHTYDCTRTSAASQSACKYSHVVASTVVPSLVAPVRIYARFMRHSSTAAAPLRSVSYIKLAPLQVAHLRIQRDNGVQPKARTTESQLQGVARGEAAEAYRRPSVEADR